MSQALAERGSSEIARPLKTLVPLIKDELDAGDQAGTEHYRRAGEMLLEAKAQVAHGEWQGWVERNFHLTSRSSTRYMKLASIQIGRARPFSTLSEAIEPDRDPRHTVSWQAPVAAITSRVNVEVLAQERQDKEKEQQLTRQLSRQLIDIGYRVLSAKLHPDKGGSAEAMTRLNKVRSFLKGTI